MFVVLMLRIDRFLFRLLLCVCCFSLIDVVLLFLLLLISRCCPLLVDYCLLVVVV